MVCGDVNVVLRLKLDCHGSSCILYRLISGSWLYLRWLTVSLVPHSSFQSACMTDQTASLDLMHAVRPAQPMFLPPLATMKPTSITTLSSTNIIAMETLGGEMQMKNDETRPHNHSKHEPCSPAPERDPQASLDALENEHLQTFRRALMNVLSIDVAELTYAQILDGLPTKESLCRVLRTDDGPSETPARS